MEEQGNLNPKYIKPEVEAKIEAITKEIIRIGIGQITDQTVGIEDSSGKTEVYTDSSKVTEEIISEIIPDNRQNSRGEYRNNNYKMTVTTEVGIGLEKDQSQEIMAVTELGVQAIVD